MTYSSQKTARCFELARFFAQQRFFGFEIPGQPYLENEGSRVFQAALQNCSFYLEYGSGGSTVLAARLKKRFISVETDRHYLTCVRRKIGELAPDQCLLHADVGLTGPWGTPFRRRATPTRISRWIAGLEQPWRLIRHGDAPDLVLIDGRFRVAATLICCDHLKASPQTSIFVDDYVTDSNYHPIENFATLAGTVGRMAIFHPAPAVDLDALRIAIAHYSADWR
ncbi:MAG TPA: hypothetical protein VMT64_16915 [Candidatus Binataceae bacterium]|nr:hypothetical protein [Candidatus Binataceae bacterium]